MQLFSIGLYKLNNNGTEMRDANNHLIPTYNNTDIAGLAKVFTGLSWSHSRYLGENSNVNDLSYTKRLKFFRWTRVINTSGHGLPIRPTGE